LSPIQVAILPINNKKHLTFSKKIHKLFIHNQIQSSLNESDERLNKKIRDAQIKKIPYQIIIGDNEIKTNKISYREYGKTATKTIPINKFISLISQKIKNKTK
jgi:threonyl-tRNA synthetase